MRPERSQSKDTTISILSGFSMIRKASSAPCRREELAPSELIGFPAVDRCSSGVLACHTGLRSCGLYNVCLETSAQLGDDSYSLASKHKCVRLQRPVIGVEHGDGTKRF